MPRKIGPGAKARYRATHPVISLQLTKEEYDSLDRIRKIGDFGWADIMKRSLQVPSTEEGKFTMEGCIALEERIKVLEAQLKNSVSSRLDIHACSVHSGFFRSFNLNEKKDRETVDSILSKAIKDTLNCPLCNPRNARYPGYGRR